MVFILKEKILLFHVTYTLDVGVKNVFLMVHQNDTSNSREKVNGVIYKRSILDFHCIKDSLHIGNKYSRFWRIGIYWDATKIDKSRTMHRALVVAPYHDCFMQAVSRDNVDHVFLPLKKFLAQDSWTVPPIHHLRFHQDMEMIFGFFEGMAKLDSIGSSCNNMQKQKCK